MPSTDCSINQRLSQATSRQWPRHSRRLASCLLPKQHLLRELVAALVIECAQTGERDPARQYEFVLCTRMTWKNTIVSGLLGAKVSSRGKR
jgi:hypothetical protein